MCRCSNSRLCHFSVGNTWIAMTSLCFRFSFTSYSSISDNEHKMQSITKKFRPASFVCRQRPLQLTSRLIHTSPSSHKADPHSADHYFKDVDTSPPSDSTMHRVDAGVEGAQRPHDPPSGPWSRAGTQTDEYTNVDKGYSLPGENRDTKEEERGSYGAVTDVKTRKKRGSKSEGTTEQGPNKGDAGGRH